jgi:hypothetical protein
LTIKLFVCFCFVCLHTLHRFLCVSNLFCKTTSLCLKLLDNHRKSQQYIDLLQNKLKVDFTKLFMPIILEIILKCIKSVRLHVQLLYFLYYSHFICYSPLLLRSLPINVINCIKFYGNCSTLTGAYDWQYKYLFVFVLFVCTRFTTS